MLNLVRVSVIGVTGCKLFNDLPLRLNLLEWQHAAIRSNRSAIELGDHVSGSASLKDQLLTLTLCLHFIAPSLWSKFLCLHCLYHEKELALFGPMRNPGYRAKQSLGKGESNTS